MPGPMTMQLCIDQREDSMLAEPGAQQDMRQRCSKMDVKRAGNTVTINSVCSLDGHTAAGKWLGPCKPGQHGSTTMSGMGPGGLRMDPETMQRLQQQYGC